MLQQTLPWCILILICSAELSQAKLCLLQVDQGNRGYYPFGMGSAKNPFAQEDRKEAFNAYGTVPPHRIVFPIIWAPAVIRAQVLTQVL